MVRNSDKNLNTFPLLPLFPSSTSLIYPWLLCPCPEGCNGMTGRGYGQLSLLHLFLLTFPLLQHAVFCRLLNTVSQKTHHHGCGAQLYPVVGWLALASPHRDHPICPHCKHLPGIQANSYQYLFRSLQLKKDGEGKESWLKDFKKYIPNKKFKQ